MQNNNLDAELQRTLYELCTDLFTISVLDDCNAILQSLVLLAEAFPQAKSHLGRLLSRNQEHARSNTSSKLSALSTNFLYKNETARSAVSFLATLANDNVRNQRRIVENVTGVKLDIDPSKYDNRSSARVAKEYLYALTVPVTVTSTYRRWQKRQRELQKCRLPSGVPPAYDGIPMPCYCDDCLGAEQFLSTWQQHFRDLSRWSQNLDKETSTSNPHVALSTGDFFRMLLDDYQLHVCTVGEALSNQTNVYADRAIKHQSLVYYFVSPEEATAATPRTPIHFNPLHHISAIAIATEIDIATARQAQFQSDTISKSSPPELVDSSMLETDQVILFTTTTDVKSCVAVSPKYPENNEVFSSCQRHAAVKNDYLLADFLRFEEQDDHMAQCDSTVRDVGKDCEITETARQLLFNMVAFCENDNQIPLSVFRRSYCSFDEYVESALLSVKITITAMVFEQVLQISCVPTNSECTTFCSFSTCIPQQQLMGANSTGDKGDLSLLCLTDEALENLLHHCRICTCDNQQSHPDTASDFYLRSSTPENEEHVPEVNDGADESTFPENDGLQRGATIRIPLSGLSCETKRKLVKLEKAVSEEKYRSLTCASLVIVMKKLAKVVADCSERISYLSIARDKELVRATTEINRAAAISRCRHCRNLLIQLGKTLALKVKPLDTSAPISVEKISRVAILVRLSIRDILTQSETFDPWETPDTRVEKLHLNRRIWASGFPDAAYYHDTDTRRRENRKQQQQLSQKLLQQKKKQSKDDARTK